MTKIKCLLTYVKKRLPIFLLILVAATSVATGAAYAKYVTNVDSNVSMDVSSIGDIEIMVVKNANGTFTIRHDTANAQIPAYIRFAVIANWADDDGNLYYVNPAQHGITVDGMTVADSCTKLGDYYYYNGALSVGEEISDIKVVAVGASAPAGYNNLRVTVLAEGIQCWPDAVVKDAWNATFNGTSWIR